MKRRLYSILFAVLLLTGCGHKEESIPGVDDMVETVAVNEEGDIEYEPTEETEPEEEAYVLTFEASTIDGEAITSECFANSKLTMLNVWATYCGPCLEEMPYLGEIAAAYDKTEFQIIGIISDVAENSKEDVVNEAKDLIARTGANYQHLLLSESLYNNLIGAVSAVPTTFFVNQEGEVLGYLVGAYSKEDWEEMINELLETVEQ